MKKQNAITPALAVSAALLVCSTNSSASPLPAVPDNLKAPADQVLVLEAQATGVQIYACSTSKGDVANAAFIAHSSLIATPLGAAYGTPAGY